MELTPINCKTNSPKWNFIEIAKVVAQRSKDPNTKTGAVLVSPDQTIISTGYNGFPRGVNDHERRWERPHKYNYVVHAEQNAILNAARQGVSTKDSTLYFNYTPHICDECLKAIIQAGIVRICGSDTPFPGVGDGVGYKIGDTGVGKYMLEEAKISVQILKEQI